MRIGGMQIGDRPNADSVYLGAQRLFGDRSDVDARELGQVAMGTGRTRMFKNRDFGDRLDVSGFQNPDPRETLQDRIRVGELRTGATGSLRAVLFPRLYLG